MSPAGGDLVNWSCSVKVSEPMASSYLAVTGDGHVWMASQFSNGTWAKWLDLETYTATYSGGNWSGTYTAVADVGTFSGVGAGQNVGAFTAVACA